MTSSGQYATDANLRARQRFWREQDPRFDLVGWVLDLAQLTAGVHGFALDVGCGNGAYLRALERRGIASVGTDLSIGMLAAAAPHSARVNADVLALPFRSDAFDAVVAAHMLYHVEDRVAAVHELHRVLTPGGICVAVTNGARHTGALHELVELAVRTEEPDWHLGGAANQAFSLENGEAQLRSAFDDVRCVRPTGVAPYQITDAGIAADYVASLSDVSFHEWDRATGEAARRWARVVEDVREAVQRRIDADGVFLVESDTGAFVCR